MDEVKPKFTGKFGKGNPGKPKGAKTKVTGDIKAMILEALGNAGGAKYLEARANDPRTSSAFLSLIGKVLPLTIHGSGANGEHSFTVIEHRIVKAATK